MNQNLDGSFDPVNAKARLATYMSSVFSNGAIQIARIQVDDVTTIVQHVVSATAWSG